MKVYLKVIKSKKTVFEQTYDGEKAKDKAIEALTEYASYKNGLITNIERASFKRNDLAGHNLNIVIKFNIGDIYYYTITD